MFDIICNSSEHVNYVKKKKKRIKRNKTSDWSTLGEEQSAFGDTFSPDESRRNSERSVDRDVYEFTKSMVSDSVDGETPRKKKKNKGDKNEETLKKKKKRDKIKEGSTLIGCYESFKGDSEENYINLTKDVMKKKKKTVCSNETYMGTDEFVLSNERKNRKKRKKDRSTKSNTDKHNGDEGKENRKENKRDLSKNCTQPLGNYDHLTLERDKAVDDEERKKRKKKRKELKTREYNITHENCEPAADNSENTSVLKKKKKDKTRKENFEDDSHETETDGNCNYVSEEINAREPRISSGSYSFAETLTPSPLNQRKKKRKLHSLSDVGTLLSNEEFVETRLLLAANAVIDQQISRVMGLVEDERTVENEMVMEEVDNEMDTVSKEETEQLISIWHTPTPTPTAPPSPTSFKSKIRLKNDNNNLEKIRVEDTKDITTKLVHGEENTDDDLTTTSNLNGTTNNLDYTSENVSKLVKRRRTMENYEDLCKRLLGSPSNVDPCPQAPATIRTRPAVTIRTFYRLPKRKYVSPDLFEICRFILGREVKVSPVNRVYQEWCRPQLETRRMDEAARQELEKYHGGRFDRYFGEEDLMILNRLEELEREGLVRNRGELCEMLRKPSSREKRRKSCLLARNILGLWVGQDIPHMIAADHCKRLVVLIKRELEEKARAEKEHVKDEEEDVKDEEEDVKDEEEDVKVHEKSVTFRRWTEDQDRHLMELVLIKNEKEGKVSYMSLSELSKLDPMEMDWEGIALEFPGRNPRGVREHWKRALQPLLVERFSPQSILSYRRRLVSAVQNQGAQHRHQVDWVTLASTFHPKSVASLQQDLGDMTMYSCGKKRGTVETSTAFLRRLRLALNGLDQMDLLTEEQLSKRFRGFRVKQALYDHYQYLLTL